VRRVDGGKKTGDGQKTMKIERKFTTAKTGAYGEIAFTTTTSEIRNPDGTIVFRNEAVETPEGWSQVASDVLAQKYFRKAGVPARMKKVKEKGVPEFLWRSVPDEAALGALPAQERFVGETSAKQVFDRLAGAWTYWGWKGGYFTAEEDARAYYDEMRFYAGRTDGRAEPDPPVVLTPARRIGSLWHRRPVAGPLLRRFHHRQADQIRQRL